MLNKIMIVLLVIIIAGSGVTGFYVYNQSQTIDSLNKQLAASQQSETIQINELKNSEDSQIAALGTELTSDQVANITSITGLQNHLNQVDGENTTLGTELDAASTRITTLDGKIDSGLSAVSSQVSSITPGVAADKIYSKVSSSIVQITDGTYTCGAGFVYDFNGDIITAAHVVQGLSSITVILSNGNMYKASLVGSALHSDVAVLKLPVSSSPPVIMAADNSTSVGDDVFAVGHPYDFTNSLSSGIVSQIHRFVDIGSSNDEHWLADLIQFDAATNPGNSGGPLFDQNGNVVGMVVAGVVPEYGSGINFAVSSARINQVANELIKNGSASYPEIGVFVDDITPTEASSLGMTSVNGALVINTSPSLPAASAGIIKGDIITAIGSTQINCAEDLYSYFGGQAKLGDTIVVHLTRGSMHIIISVTTCGINENHWWVSMVPASGSTATPWPES